MSNQKPEREPPLPDSTEASTANEISEEHALPSSAADDPTAMWNEDDLREAGMEEVAKRAESLPPPAATGPEVRGDVRQSVVVGDERPAPQAQRAAPRPRPGPARPSAGLSWPVTIGLAVALGLVVYFLVRLVR